jgi:uncharacterized cofD-like protein
MVRLYRNMTQKTQNITVVGGGTGTSVILSALKKLPQIKLTAIVVVSDNGGSTRKLRDEFGFLPVGDLRQCLTALADGSNQDLVRQILLYRFKKGDGLMGHNLGNLILTALEDLHTSPGKAIEVATQIFRVRGQVLPVTEQVTQLKIEYTDGTVLEGEEHLDDPALGGKTIKKLSLNPKASLYPKAEQALHNSNTIILGPGDLYGSLLPNTLATGFTTALANSSAKFIYIVNLMTRFTQTHGMTAADHVETVVRYAGRVPDVIVLNTEAVPPKILQKYAEQNEFPVQDDLTEWEKLHPKTKVIRGNFLSKVIAVPIPGDALERSLLRHDGEALAQVLA